SPRILQDVPRFVEPSEPAKSGCPPVISIFLVRLKFERLFKFFQCTEMITDIEKRMSPDKVKRTGPRHTFYSALRRRQRFVVKRSGREMANLLSERVDVLGVAP